MSGREDTHILIFPHPAQGHLIPLLDLTFHLSSCGLSITVVVTPENLSHLDPLLSRSPSVKPLVLPIPSHHSLAPGFENLKDKPSQSSSSTSFTASFVRALSSLSQPISLWFRSHPNPPVALVSDFFLGWTESLAIDLSIPRLVFYSSGALLVSVLNHLYNQHQKGYEIRIEDNQVDIWSLPNSPRYPYAHLPSVYRRSIEQGAPGSDWEFMRDGMIANTTSYGGIYNTFDALEHKYLEHLRRGGHARTWAVGPVAIGALADCRGGHSSVSCQELAVWLDACDEGSVVYACFGSQADLSEEQAEAVARGLEGSGARFVWVVRGGGGGRVVMEERAGGSGVVIRGWAPQAAVLGHGAVGAFLTHCGWNSVLEGMAAGVALLAWPMTADQFVNARLLVEEAGAAVRVCEGADAVPDPEELGRAVAEAVGGGGRWRARVEELRRAAREAVGVGGSSRRDLGALVEELREMRVKRVMDDEGQSLKIE